MGIWDVNIPGSWKDPGQSQFWYGPIGLNPLGPTSWSSTKRSNFMRGFKAGWGMGEDALDRQIEKDPKYIATKYVLEKTYEGIMYVTPKQYEDDVDALIYYGSLGLMDPTNLADIPMWRARGFSMRASIGFMMARAIIPAAVIGWWIDPKDKREGGLAETEWYQKWTDWENYSLPSGW